MGQEKILSKARFKRRILHVPNLMEMRKIYCFRSFALDSAHVKFDVYNGPKHWYMQYFRFRKRLIPGSN